MATSSLQRRFGPNATRHDAGRFSNGNGLGPGRARGWATPPPAGVTGLLGVLACVGMSSATTRVGPGAGALGGPRATPRADPFREARPSSGPNAARHDADRFSHVNGGGRGRRPDPPTPASGPRSRRDGLHSLCSPAVSAGPFLAQGGRETATRPPAGERPPIPKRRARPRRFASGIGPKERPFLASRRGSKAY